jgi:hypothetical protein
MKMKLLGGAVALVTVFAAGVVVGQTGASYREPQFENGDVKVWKTIIMPNQPLSLHRHDHGRTIVTLIGGTLDVVEVDFETAGPCQVRLQR